MITAHVSGGHTRMLKARVIDTDDTDLSEVVFKIAMVEDGQGPPPKNDAMWHSPAAIAFPRDGEAVVSLLLDESIIPPGGRYWAWVIPTTTEDAEPIRAADDYIQSV